MQLLTLIYVYVASFLADGQCFIPASLRRWVRVRLYDRSPIFWLSVCALCCKQLRVQLYSLYSSHATLKPS